MISQAACSTLLVATINHAFGFEHGASNLKEEKDWIPFEVPEPSGGHQRTQCDS